MSKKPLNSSSQSGYGTTANNNNSLEDNEFHPGKPCTVFCVHGKRNNIEVRGHCHHRRPEGIDYKARRKLIIASILCLFFMAAEIVGGVLSNSLAIATDAAHLLTDFASFMISLFAIWLAGRPSTQRMSFGWYRAEVIGALCSVLMIWVITAILVFLAVERIVNKDFEVDAGIMLITSVLAIVVNLIMGFQLHSHSHGHGHSHSHKHKKDKKKDTGPSISSPPTPTQKSKTLNQAEHGKKTVIQSEFQNIEIEPENINVRAAFIHVLGDVLQSVGVFCAALVIYFNPDWAIADPICTFIFSFIVLCTTFAILKDTMLVLMEGTPTYLQYNEVMELFMSIDGVERVHNLRIWALSLNKVALSAHLAIAPGADPRKVLQEATTAVHLRYNFFETTIQIEDFLPEMESCKQCHALK